jgi:hypothetical protein
LRSRSTLLRRTAASITAAGVALSGAVVLTTAPAQGAVQRFETPFAFQASTYGTRVSLGNPNAGGLASGRTAWSQIGCTAMAPIRHDDGSDLARLNANSMIEVGAVTSTTTTYRRPKKKIFGTRAVNKVAGLTVGPDDGPRLVFDAVTTRAHAFNDKGRFRSQADIDVLGVKGIGISSDGSTTPEPLQQLLDAIDLADNQLVEAIIEGAGTNGIDVPGLGTIYPAGTSKTPRSRRGATANAFGIRIALENGSQVNIGRAWARIQSAHPAGVFAGHAFGLEAKLAEGVLGIGRTPYQKLPCIGTNGEWRRNALADLPQNQNLEAAALTAETFGKPFRDGRAIARSRATLAELVLAGGQLEIRNVIGQVNLFQNRRGRVVRRNIDGTQVGAVLFDSDGDGRLDSQKVPAPGEQLELGDLAVITGAVTEKLGKRGLRVHALRVEMLDGTGLTLDLGTAKAKILR